MFQFYDFECVKYDWLVVIIDPSQRTVTKIHNDRDTLTKYVRDHLSDIWVGYNSRHYDSWLLKGIVQGFNAWDLNEWIIIDDKPAYQFSKSLSEIPVINYDTMPNPPVGLKTLEGFMGSMIKETDIPFSIDRPLRPDEIELMFKYCQHDVEETMRVFMHRKADFDAQMGIVNAFDLPLRDIGMTEARITAKVLGCQHKSFDDEFDWMYLPCLQIKKYRHVLDWFKQQQEDIKWQIQLCRESRGSNEETIKKDFYKRSLETEIAGIPHTFGFGGVHGADDHPVQYEGLILHVDVNNYYPSILIAWDLVTRAATNDNYSVVYKTRAELKYKQQHASSKEESKKYKTMQMPYKKLLNSLSGAMKDKNNPAYDPRNNNAMCINGQLMLLDLIEHLEVVPGFKLVQSNTDGLIIKIDDTDEAFEMVDDICYDWEQRCSTDKCPVGLAFDYITKYIGKDVNNYLFIFEDGEIERKGGYLKPLSDLDYDLAIVNEALVEYMVNSVPVEDTIGKCNDIRKFQKIVKLTDKYDHVEHEVGKYRDRYDYKCYRVFASNRSGDGRLLKVRSNGEVAKFGNTPDHSFIINDEVLGGTIPSCLDREWYVNLAKKRLADFGFFSGNEVTLS